MLPEAMPSAAYDPKLSLVYIDLLLDGLVEKVVRALAREDVVDFTIQTRIVPACGSDYEENGSWHCICDQSV